MSQVIYGLDVARSLVIVALIYGGIVGLISAAAARRRGELRYAPTTAIRWLKRGSILILVGAGLLIFPFGMALMASEIRPSPHVVRIAETTISVARLVCCCGVLITARSLGPFLEDVFGGTPQEGDV